MSSHLVYKQGEITKGVTSHMSRDTPSLICSPNVPVIYKIRKYKYNYHRDRYEFSWSKRLGSFEECQEYVKRFERATKFLSNFFGYSHRKEDVIKIFVFTPNPDQPKESSVK